MSYQVFARKYRPLTFDDVLGQDHVVRTLTNAIKQNRLAHAYLFVGPRGTGKTSTARIFAKALNCSNGPRIDFDPNEDTCLEIAEGRSLDVLEIDGASNRGIDHIRDLRDNVRFAPTRGTYRIVYIDEVHMLTKESFNALLKTLEEPPPHVKFIFATTEPHKILPTILSRCQRFDLRPIPTDLIAKHLLHIAGLEGVNLTEEAAFAVAKVADGGMRDAQSMLDQLVSFCGNSINEQQVLDIFGITSRETVADALSLMLGRNLPALLALINGQSEAGRDMGQLLSEIIASIREALVSKVDPTAELVSVPEDRRENMALLLQQTKTDKILRLVEILSETEDKMRWSSHKRLHLEIGLIKAVHSLSEANISDIIRALDGAPLPNLPVPSAAPAPIAPRQDAPPAVEPAPSPTSENIQPEPPSNEEKPTSTAPSETSPHTEPSYALHDEVPSFIPQAETPTPEAAPAEEPEVKEELPAPEPSFSALSDTPVSPPIAEENDESAAEETEPVREDTLTGNLFGDFDSLFGQPEPAQAAAPILEESANVLDEQAWTELLEQLADRFPLKAELLRHAGFLRHEGQFFVLGINPKDRLGYETLLQDEVKTEIEKQLSTKCGSQTTLNVEYNESIPEPVEEELEPLPQPVVTAPPIQKAPRIEKNEQPASPAPEEIENPESKEDFFNDPFVQQALDIFKARIIKS